LDGASALLVVASLVVEIFGKSSLEFSTTIDVAKLFEELGLVCIA